MNTDAHLKSFLRNVFEKDVKLRPSAEECLKLDFFDKYIIPQWMSDDIFYEPYVSQEMKEPSSLDNGIVDISIENIAKSYKNCLAVFLVEFSMRSKESDRIEVKYPELEIQAEPTVKYLFENASYMQMLMNVFERFDAICRFHTVSHTSR